MSNKFAVLAEKFYRKNCLRFLIFLVIFAIDLSLVFSQELLMQSELDSPLLFTKRHSYSGIHIYDTMYKWPPGGGGIYLLENPSDAQNEWRIRPIVDPTTPETCGDGVYTDPELSFDAKKILFCFKGTPEGSTNIYEINIDGTNLRQITDATLTCDAGSGTFSAQHDISPAYLPDGRIVFLSTRPSGLVPCNNTGVAILHIMNADGTDIHPISVNNVNEFDPAILPDGRILFGRWEYIDKSALVVQSLWTINPDGTNESAFFANNMVFPEAILDARPVFTADPQDGKSTSLIVGTLAKHNSVPRGSVAFIDVSMNKNGIQMINNPEHPDVPETDTGNSCEPWPINDQIILFSGRPEGANHNTIELINREGKRTTLLSDPEICLHDPMLVKARPIPTNRIDTVDRNVKTGRFFLQDIYRGLEGVNRGEAKWLRVIEETSRVSATPRTPTDYNQTFIISPALAFSVKNYLGITPIQNDGSAYFEVPSGKAVYFQVLDKNMRQIRTMRTFIQAAPGTTRSCIGCHEPKNDTPSTINFSPSASGIDAHILQPENWGENSPGTGSIDYPTVIQPIFDQKCVTCHGGSKGVAGGMDLCGSPTKYFNISYENLTSRHETQLVAYWISAIDCMNGTAWKSVPIQSPRSHGTGNAPLADILDENIPNNHLSKGYLNNLTQGERNRIYAWIDSNGVYNGTWDYSPAGQATVGWDQTVSELKEIMVDSGCAECHHSDDSQSVDWFEEDWINLQSPKMSRILRAPLPAEYSAQDIEKYGLGACRDHQVRPEHRRILQLWSGYYHGVLTLDKVPEKTRWVADTTGKSYSSFKDVNDPIYERMLATIQRGREKMITDPRVDMPGAEIIPGASRSFIPQELPNRSPQIFASVYDGSVSLSWEASAKTIGLTSQIWRISGEHPGFMENSRVKINAISLCDSTKAQRFLDAEPTTGDSTSVTYALVVYDPISLKQCIASYVVVNVTPPEPPAAPQWVIGRGIRNGARLSWAVVPGRGVSYYVYRSAQNEPKKVITKDPLTTTSITDLDLVPGITYTYDVVAIRRGVESVQKAITTVIPTENDAPVFSTDNSCYDFLSVPNSISSVSFPYEESFAVQPMTIECSVQFNTHKSGEMPVLLGCGIWNQTGWFLQWLGDHFRFYCGKLDCDGGMPVTGQWIDLAATIETDPEQNTTLRLYQNGTLVAEKTGLVSDAIYGKPLVIGQYCGETTAPYQLHGEIKNIRIWDRPLDPAEISNMLP